MTDTRTALTATGRVRVEPAGGPRDQRVYWAQSWPVVVRRTGPDRVHLVHGAGGPLGGDRFGLDVDLAAGTRLRVGSAGATLVQPGSADSARWVVRADCAAGT